MRGDWWGKLASGSSFKKRYQIELSEEDKIKITDRAKEIYDDLQARRMAQGLGEFDNSVPDSVINFYEAILSAQ